MTWTEDQMQKCIHLSTAKAKGLFAILKEEAGADYHFEFIASSGWFEHFKNHYSSCNAEESGESVSADTKAAGEFLETLDTLILGENYLPE